MPPAKITVENLHQAFGALTVIESLNLAVGDGEFVAVVGPSGCGKSTLLRMISGLASPTAGRILIDGLKVTGPNPKHNLVFQEHALYPWRTVFHNVALGLEMQNRSAADIRERVQTLLALVGLEKFAHFYPHQLSGGMRQRAALARVSRGSRCAPVGRTVRRCGRHDPFDSSGRAAPPLGTFRQNRRAGDA